MLCNLSALAEHDQKLIVRCHLSIAERPSDLHALAHFVGRKKLPHCSNGFDHRISYVPRTDISVDPATTLKQMNG